MKEGLIIKIGTDAHVWDSHSTAFLQVRKSSFHTQKS